MNNRTIDQMFQDIKGPVQLYKYEDGTFNCNHDDIPIGHELETMVFDNATDAVAAVWLFLRKK